MLTTKTREQRRPKKRSTSETTVKRGTPPCVWKAREMLITPVSYLNVAMTTKFHHPGFQIPPRIQRKVLRQRLQQLHHHSRQRAYTFPGSLFPHPPSFRHFEKYVTNENCSAAAAISSLACSKLTPSKLNSTACHSATSFSSFQKRTQI